MDAKRLSRIGESVPRYTSYPTAPHFHAGIGDTTVREWLGAVEPCEPVSLYLHIPFCDRLCWFCACHTKQIRRYEPVAQFLVALRDEIELVAAARSGLRVGAVHFGGGSPTMLRPDGLIDLDRSLRNAFDYSPGTSVCVEIDPNDMDEARLDALAAIGLTRASLGIQDFEPRVQAAINREQGFDVTSSVVEGLRRRGIGSVNFDLLYGLPHQTIESIAATVRLVLSLGPDRLALFGYAHVPWFKKHQTMIDEAWLPGAEDRLAQSLVAADMIRQAGYVQIGLDHFAKPCDSLAVAAARGRLRRNFQGYTDDACETLVGLGPSSVSRYAQGHAQNVHSTGEYRRLVAEGRLPVIRGVDLSADDRVRGWVIERLMCDFGFDAQEARTRFGPRADPILATAATLSEIERLLERRGERFIVPDAERVLVRTIAARFDAYLPGGAARHSVAV
ncbi:MAG: oxygen-independent coproporphyrinogen III oxidase [Rhizobiaceae bacterium]